MWVFLHFMHNNLFILGKNYYHMKKEEILWMEFFKKNLVMFYEPQI